MQGLDVLQRHDLAEVLLLHAAGDGGADRAADEGRGLLESGELLGVALEVFGMGEEVGDKAAPTRVAQEILRVVLRLQVPLLPLAMLHTEVTHDRLRVLSSAVAERLTRVGPQSS
jgi:hypothetical protein